MPLRSLPKVPPQPLNLPIIPTRESTAGRVFVVTGANVGLGYEAAKHLASLGAARVIVAGRNLSACQAAAAETAQPGVAVDAWHLDLSSYASVISFADRAASELDRLDVLISNAAVASTGPELAEGHLAPVTVNVTSTLLLTVLLLPKLRETAGRFPATTPHAVFVASSSAWMVPRPELDKMTVDPLGSWDAVDEAGREHIYRTTKLLGSLAARELAARLPSGGDRVVVNLACPGFCRTSLSRHVPDALWSQLNKMYEEIGRTAEDGSRTLLHAAFAGRESHGKFCAHCEIHDEQVPVWVTDEVGQKAQKTTWNAIVRELEAVRPGCIEKALRV